MTKQKRQNYTKEFKKEAVKLITIQGYSMAEAARNLGVNATLLVKASSLRKQAVETGA